jgi:hypothetical protein
LGLLGVIIGSCLSEYGQSKPQKGKIFANIYGQSKPQKGKIFANISNIPDAGDWANTMLASMLVDFTFYNAGLCLLAQNNLGCLLHLEREVYVCILIQ